MNRHDLVHLLATRGGLTPSCARHVLDLLFGAGAVPGLIPDSLDRGDRVSIAGFGTFLVRRRAARRLRDPRTGESRFVPACRAAVFRPGNALRSRLR